MDQDLSTFRLPFCRRPPCRFHLHLAGWRWICFGSFSRQCEPRIVPCLRRSHYRGTVQLADLLDPRLEYHQVPAAQIAIPRNPAFRLAF